MSLSNGTSAGSSSAALPTDQNIRFLHGAEFRHPSPMRFEGEAEILLQTIFHDSVTFITDKVQIFGQATYQGVNDTSVLAPVPFDHLAPSDYRDWNVPFVSARLVNFPKKDGIIKFATGDQVVFHGPVTFNGAVTLVKPIFHGDVKFAAQPDSKNLVGE
ncbi:hypothetical protein BLS_009080 [Venturia inaequalis]|uniref:Uncharacterized protein n=1 Tax=Venturia inaequalis TaxID=5025 RepID=A0A8H3YL29_VENIN|nr:hypothetical protein BLS_009080 [Venturia inaequalis]